MNIPGRHLNVPKVTVDPRRSSGSFRAMGESLEENEAQRIQQQPPPRPEAVFKVEDLTPPHRTTMEVKEEDYTTEGIHKLAQMVAGVISATMGNRVEEISKGLETVREILLSHPKYDQQEQQIEADPAPEVRPLSIQHESAVVHRKSEETSPAPIEEIRMRSALPPESMEPIEGRAVEIFVKQVEQVLESVIPQMAQQEVADLTEKLEALDAEAPVPWTPFDDERMEKAATALFAGEISGAEFAEVEADAVRIKTARSDYEGRREKIVAGIRQLEHEPVSAMKARFDEVLREIFMWRERQRESGSTVGSRFKVSTGTTYIAVSEGSHWWYDSGLKEYSQQTVSSATTGWASVAKPSASSTLYVYLLREHTSGAYTTCETLTCGTNSSLTTIRQLADDYTKVWVIAKLTADSDGAITIDQYIWQDIEDGPDIRISGTVALWAGPTAPHGWVLCDGTSGSPDLRKMFVAGYDSGDASYNCIGAGTNSNSETGYKWHGMTENNHPDHDLEHSHGIAPTPTQVAASGADAVPSPLAQDVWAFATDPVLNDGCTGDNTNWHTDPTSCTDWTGPSVYDATSYPSTGLRPVDNLAQHRGPFPGTGMSNDAKWKDTDNRPPYYVMAYIWKL